MLARDIPQHNLPMRNHAHDLHVRGNLIFHVTEVKIVGPCTLELSFDGLRKRISLRGELCGPIFEPLKDPAYFAKAFLDLDSRTVAWPSGAGFAPDYLAQLDEE